VLKFGVTLIVYGTPLTLTSGIVFPPKDLIPIVLVGPAVRDGAWC
jgi:hypothetical protein